MCLSPEVLKLFVSSNPLHTWKLPRTSKGTSASGLKLRNIKYTAIIPLGIRAIKSSDVNGHLENSRVHSLIRVKPADNMLVLEKLFWHHGTPHVSPDHTFRTAIWIQLNEASVYLSLKPASCPRYSKEIPDFFVHSNTQTPLTMQTGGTGVPKGNNPYSFL